ETPENPFIAPANIHTIEAFMNKVGYQGVVDKKFPNIPKRLKEDYHSIKDDVPLIRETNDFKEYHTVFMKVSVLMNQLQPVVSTQGTNRNTPRAPRTSTVSASPQESKKRKQTIGESSSKRIIIKKKNQSTPSIPLPGDDRERDEMAEATILSLTLHKTALDAEAKENIAKLEPESHKQHPEHVSDDDEMRRKDKEVKEEKKVVEIVQETNVDDISAKKNNEVVTEKELFRKIVLVSNISNSFQYLEGSNIPRTVRKVPDTEDMIKFMLDTQQLTYIVDMFRDTLHLLVETPENPFVSPVNIHTIEAFMNKKFPNIPKRLKDDYHSTKDDVPLIRETDNFKEYETMFMKVDVLLNQPQPVVSTQGTNKNTPRAPKTPTVSASPQESKRGSRLLDVFEKLYIYND
nr:hypothetical protein [Tanacetum cinerariifolium]